MSYQMCWEYDSLIPNQPRASNGDLRYPCFSQLVYQPKKTFTVWFSLTEYVFGKHRDVCDYSDEFLKGERFTRLVNYWVEIGRKIGLRFPKLVWGWDKKTKQFWFTWDITFLRRLKSQTTKTRILWLHCFWFRLLNERHATIWAVAKYRTRIQKRYPFVSLVAVVAMCERYVYYDNYDNKFPKYMEDSHYRVSGHWLFQYVHMGRQLRSCLEPNILTHVIENNMGNSFDSNLYPEQLALTEKSYSPLVVAKHLNLLAKEAINREKETVCF